MKDKCVHHWVLESSLAAAVAGVCRECGELRVFSGGSVKYGSFNRSPREGERDA
jgi:hypothetical protein